MNKKVSVDQNGLLNLKKLNDDNKSEESVRVKKLQHELDNLKSKYYSIKQDFELMTLNNSELKATIYSLQDKKYESHSNDQDYIIQNLKNENNEFVKKINILTERINELSDKLKYAENNVQIQEKIIYKEKEVIKKREYIDLKQTNIIDFLIKGKIKFYC